MALNGRYFDVPLIDSYGDELCMLTDDGHTFYTGINRRRQEDYDFFWQCLSVPLFIGLVGWSLFL
jgi:hypothetical protein